MDVKSSKNVSNLNWTNPSVLLFSHDRNPSEMISEKAQEVVFNALQKGWSGPPFDPFQLAEIMGVNIVPNESVVDARISSSSKGKLTVEYNPNRSFGRMRFSIAHELAHTLFPDCKEHVRNRLQKEAMREDEWQLEMLCNLGAAEFLMPIGSFPELREHNLDIDRLMELQKEYKVSSEALLLRVVKLTDVACFAFSACQHDIQDIEVEYSLDYAVTSKLLDKTISAGMLLPKKSCVTECTGIGFTAKNDEVWPQLGAVHVECVGLPPYPGHVMPRVAGIVRPSKKKVVNNSINQIRFLKGDVLEPRGLDKKIIAFIVNDKGLSWGAGFAKAVQQKWPIVQKNFEKWIRNRGRRSLLGATNWLEIEDNITFFEMVAQHGYGPSPKPRIRYSALYECLNKLAKHAKLSNASIHMPRIGSGQAGGNWLIIEELIQETLCQKGIEVTVYDLPNKFLFNGREKHATFFD